MSNAEKDKAQRKWKIYSDRYYSKQKSLKELSIDSIRPSTSSSLCYNDKVQPIQSKDPQVQIITPKLIAARERSKRQRRKRNLKLNEKDKIISKLKTKINTFNRRYQRLKANQQQAPQALSLKAKMTMMAEDPKIRREAVKKAVLGESLENQIAENIKNLKTLKEKKVANKILLGPIVAENKVWKIKNKIITYKKMWHSRTQRVSNQKRKRNLRNLKNVVQQFFEDDRYSRLCAGKKEFITRKKVRKQKRYLLNTVRNLHKEFLKGGNIISYSLLARLKPFWVVAPKVSGRDTCMCTAHNNIELIINSLRNAKVLKVSSYENLLKSLCCDRYHEKCLRRTCEACFTRSIEFSDELNETKIIKYRQWVSGKESFLDLKTKKEKIVTKQKKEFMETTTQDLMIKLKKDLEKIFQHEGNIIHQYKAIKTLKDTLTENDVIIHMDFSENYNKI